MCVVKIHLYLVNVRLNIAETLTNGCKDIAIEIMQNQTERNQKRMEYL